MSSSSRWHSAATANIVLRLLAAIVVVLAPLTMSAWFALCPQYRNPACPTNADPLAVLHAYRSAPAALREAFLIVNFITPYLFPLSYLALGSAVLRRSPWFAMLGMAAGWIGAMPWAFISDQSFLLVDMTRFHSDGVFANLETAYIQDPHIFLIAAGWVLGHLLGYVFLGIALVRSAVVPRWSGALLVVATPVMGPLAYGSGLNILQILAYLLVAVASVPVARVLLAGQSLDESRRHAPGAASSST